MTDRHAHRCGLGAVRDGRALLGLASASGAKAAAVGLEGPSRESDHDDLRSVDPQTSISPDQVARVVARLQRGWLGVYVTTGVFSQQAHLA